MKKIVVIDNETGKEVNYGDEIVSFRGEKAVLINATRENIGYKSGKIVVYWVNDKYYGEYYDKVFNVTVRSIEK